MKVTRALESKAHVFALCGALSVDYQGALRIAKLESLARALRRRFEATCSHAWANTESYEKRTEAAIQNAIGLCSGLDLANVEINRDPRGAAVKLTTKGGREFYL